MANTKEYRIQINGLTESINAVDSLNKQLDALEKRINAINAMKVTTPSGGGGGTTAGRTSARSTLTEEQKLEKQIAQIDAKREAYSKEIYQNYLAAKDVLKETVDDQKQIAAQERLQSSAYTNTMQGLKQELADVKQVMQTTTLDSDMFGELSARADEITKKLKQIEEAYGTFGRNVGNYKSAFEELGKVTITLNGVTQEFDNLKQAQKALRDGMGVLEVQGKKDTAMYRQMERELERVSKAQLRLNSAISDAKASSRIMDDLLDTFQSVGALGQIGQGFSTLFGIDDSEIEKQIAKLVALQNALQGVEKIRQQMNTGEGIGKIFGSASKEVDKFVAKLAGADFRMGKIIGSTKQASVALNVFSNVLKGIGGIAISGGFMLLTTMIGNLVDKFKEWYSGGMEAGDATKILESSVAALDETTERLLEEDTENYFYNLGNESAHAKNQIEMLTSKVLQLIGAMHDLNDIDIKKFDETSSLSLIGTKSLEDARKRFKDIAGEIENLEKKAKDSAFGETIYGWFSGINGHKRDLKELGTILAGDFVARAESAIQKAREETLRLGYVTKDTAREIKDLKREMNENGTTKGVLDNIEKFCDDSPRFITQLNSVRDGIVRLSGAINTVDPSKLEQYIIDGMADSEAKIRKQNELNRKKEIESVNFNPEYVEAINKKYDTELKESLKAYRKSKKQETDQKKKEERDAQNQINELRIQLMREGLAKEIAALEEERRQALKRIQDEGVRVSELSQLTQQVYDKRLLELKRDWSYDMEKVYVDMYKKILDAQKDAYDKMQDNELTDIGNNLQLDKDNAWRGIIDPSNPNNISDRNRYYDELIKIELDAYHKEQEIRRQSIEDERKYNEDEEKLRHDRMVDMKTQNLVMEELSKNTSPEGVDYSSMEKALQNELSKLKGEIVDEYNNGKIDFQQFVKLIEEEQKAHTSTMEALQREYNTKINTLTKEGLDKNAQIYNTYYTNLLSSVRSMQDEVARNMQRTPIKNNDWGVVQISRTKEQYSTALDAYRNISGEIVRIQQDLKKDLQDGNIKEEDFFMRNNELEAMKKSINDATKEIVTKQKNLVADFLQSMQQYIQAAMDSFNTIMQAVWEAQDNQFDKEADELDKLNETLDKKLDEQQEIVEKHKSAIDSIEDELATSRGDRRQHLIDQLNAEMTAQREAQKQEQKIQKEKEAAQKKQDELEKKRKKAQYHRDQMQAIVNGAMAVTYAAMNTWPIPAIPMMALAAATTAAQLAIMASNKPYAKGGLLEGKSHAQGGIPIPGTGIEVEGKEYVIRKKSTAPNIDVLDYINKSERKLTLDDFIDFYASGKAKRTINSISPSRHFADGGTIPSLSTDIDINDRLLNTMEAYANRPVVVSVVDINNRQAAVRNVQVLAGIEN